MQYKGPFFSIIHFLALSLSGYCQTIDLSRYPTTVGAENISIYQISSDLLFTGKQNIFVVEIQNEAHLRYRFAIAHSDSSLRKTSRFAEENKAIIALNGGFFDVVQGGSVAYLESEGKVIAETRNSQEKWAKSDSLLNGAIIVDNSGSLKVEIANPAIFYEKSYLSRIPHL